MSRNVVGPWYVGSILRGASRLGVEWISTPKFPLTQFDVNSVSNADSDRYFHVILPCTPTWFGQPWFGTRLRCKLCAFGTFRATYGHLGSCATSCTNRTWRKDTFPRMPSPRSRFPKESTSSQSVCAPLLTPRCETIASNVGFFRRLLHKLIIHLH